MRNQDLSLLDASSGHVRQLTRNTESVHMKRKKNQQTLHERIADSTQKIAHHPCRFVLWEHQHKETKSK
jgi:hypothetical protein